MFEWGEETSVLVDGVGRSEFKAVRGPFATNQDTSSHAILSLSSE